MIHAEDLPVGPPVPDVEYRLGAVDMRTAEGVEAAWESLYSFSDASAGEGVWRGFEQWRKARMQAHGYEATPSPPSATLDSEELRKAMDEHNERERARQIERFSHMSGRVATASAQDDVPVSEWLSLTRTDVA